MRNGLKEHGDEHATCLLEKNGGGQTFLQLGEPEGACKMLHFVTAGTAFSVRVSAAVMSAMMIMALIMVIAHTRRPMWLRGYLRDN